MEPIPTGFNKLLDSFLKIVTKSDSIIGIIPNVLQLIGIIGLFWYGTQFFRDRRWTGYNSKLLKSILAWAVGKFLEYFLIISSL